jgi:hypothetical protein
VLRALMSSADAPSNWDLRCDVRERLLAFLAEHYPDQLPRIRAEVPPAAILAGPAATADGRPQDRPQDQSQDRPQDRSRSDRGKA